MKNKTITFFNASTFWGGGEKWHASMAEKLAERGFDIHFIGYPHGALFDRLADNPSITYHPLKVKKWAYLHPLKRFQLKKLLSFVKPHAVIINGSSEMKLAAMATPKGLTRLIYRRGLDKRVKATALNKYLLNKKITGIIANSEATKRSLLGNPPFLPAEKVKVLYNGFELDPFLAIPQKEVNPQKWIIGTAGRLVPQKGHELLLHALAELNQMDFELRVAGTGPQRDELESMARRLKIEKKVSFLGFVKDMPGFYGEIDFFVLPSLWEGFGFALAEAMASGKALIAFDLSSNPELVQHGTNGLLVKEANIEPLQHAISQLMQHPDLCMSFGKNGREFSRKFELASAVDQLLTYIFRDSVFS